MHLWRISPPSHPRTTQAACGVEHGDIALLPVAFVAGLSRAGWALEGAQHLPNRELCLVRAVRTGQLVPLAAGVSPWLITIQQDLAEDTVDLNHLVLRRGSSFKDQLQELVETLSSQSPTSISTKHLRCNCILHGWDAAPLARALSADSSRRTRNGFTAPSQILTDGFRKPFRTHFASLFLRFFLGSPLG